MRALMGMQLRRDGYDLTELANGFALFAAITNVRANLMPMPSVIVSDVRMPGLSGLSILRVVREYGWRVPVVLITAFGSEETLNEAAKLEASNRAAQTVRDRRPARRGALRPAGTAAAELTACRVGHGHVAVLFGLQRLRAIDLVRTGGSSSSGASCIGAIAATTVRPTSRSDQRRIKSAVSLWPSPFAISNATSTTAANGRAGIE